MPELTYAGQTYTTQNDETVLECLTRQGVELPHACRAGICQSCMMHATHGTPPPESQQGLKPDLQRQGYFLTCQCRPTQDLSFCSPDEAALPHTLAKVVDKRLLNNDVLRLRLQTEDTFEFNAGQFINLHRDDELIRSYSIASLPESGFLELHIERIQGGKMSSWLFDELAVGDNINIEGPHGECIYTDRAATQNLLLIGTGTGLAPLWGVIQDALANEHQGEIHLFHGSRHPEKLYLTDELRQLAKQQSNFFYTACVSGSANQNFSAGRANELALAQHPQLNGSQIYLCGHPDMVNATRKKAFLAGASFNDIHADPFTPSS